MSHKDINQFERHARAMAETQLGITRRMLSEVRTRREQVVKELASLNNFVSLLEADVKKAEQLLKEPPTYGDG